MKKEWNRWSIEEEELLTKLLTIEKLSYSECAVKLNRTLASVSNKSKRLGLCSCHRRNKLRTHSEYEKLLPKNYIVLEKYSGSHSKILHKHTICRSEWYVRPADILAGYGCPYCNTGGQHYSNEPTKLYLVYFPEYNLYKIGITVSSIKRRFTEKIKVETLLTLEFKTGKEAYEKEQEFLINVKDYLVNEGILRKGNTETFRYDW